MQIAHAKSSTVPYVSISGGIAALLHNGNRSAEQLVMAADQCLHRAKRLGRNRNVAEAVALEQAIA
jgi:PleD family two-component response regulator